MACPRCKEVNSLGETQCKTCGLNFSLTPPIATPVAPAVTFTPTTVASPLTPVLTPTSTITVEPVDDEEFAEDVPRDTTPKESFFQTIWKGIKKALDATGAVIAVVIILAACLGFYTGQLWLILIPLGFLPLCHMWRSSTMWYLAGLLTFTWEAISLAICLSQIKHFLK